MNYVKLNNAPMHYNQVYHKNGKLYVRVVRKQAYPPEQKGRVTYIEMNNANIKKYMPNNIVSNNIGYKKNGNHYIKVKKHSGLIWLPVTPISNRYKKHVNGKFVKVM
jgi:hypothetical protein